MNKILAASSNIYVKNLPNSVGKTVPPASYNAISKPYDDSNEAVRSNEIERFVIA